MAIRKEVLRIMADTERRMDSGELPFVLAPGPTGIFERFPLDQERMDDYGLVSGQRINTIIRDAILEESDSILQKRLFEMVDKLNQIAEEVEDSMMEEDFDFRNMMKDEDGNEPTKH